MVVDSAQIARPLLGSMGDARFFPPSLVPPTVADSLVHIEVAGPNGGDRIFSYGPDSRAYSGTDTLGRAYGDMMVTASISPGAAPLLLAGGLPASRAPTIVALVVLAIGLGIAALLLLRREQRLVRLREDFVSGVSHELRTPLTQIRMLSELLQRDGFKNDSERSRATDVINREAMRLTNLVDNILDFTRLRRAVGSNARAPIALAEVAREVGDAFAPLLEAQGNRLELAVAHDARVACDRDALNRVMRNLVENAIKYGPKGQTIRVTIGRGDNGASTALITIDDEGPGIPRDEWTRIWQPYYRLDRDRNVAMGGSGLGLAVVADLTRMLGGRVWVGDAPGKGARFTVEIPSAS
jgi:signal transduction histidine kinase